MCTNVQQKVDIACPICGRSLGSCDTAIRYLRFPSIACSKCGFTGPYEWVNPSLGISVEEAGERLASAKTKMYAARLKRPTPYVDKTIYVGWNGMMISAYLEAGRVLDLPEVRAFALKSLDRVLGTAWDPGVGMAHVVAYGEAGGSGARVAGVLEDYVFLGNAALDAAYGEALVVANNGAVPQEAEEAFNAALAVDPHNAPARFYLGLARIEHKDNAGAIQLWQSLLNDTPATSPLHQMLVDRIAMLTSQMSGPGGGAPNPRAMVAMLAARLKADPHDALGWVRLMRAYTVLGETEKAKQALADARKAFPDNQDAQTAFSTAAKALKIN